MRFSTAAHRVEKYDGPSILRQNSATRAGQRAPVRRRANTDEVKLLMLGYRQELAREFTLFNCFGSSFAALSTLTALGGTFGIGLTYGGPVVMTWGWLVVTFFTISVGLSMAELASAYPTSGALYYWSFKLAPKRLRNLACWMTGWVLTMGQAAFSASNSYTFVHLVSAVIKVQYDVELSPLQQFLLLVGFLVVIGLLNCGSARLTAFMTTLGTLWHLVALAAFCVVVPLLAPERNTARYVYTSWQPHHEYTGISSPVYTVLVGLLMQQWTLTGYDGSPHVAEETFHAEVNVPRAILLTILGVGATGYAFTLSLLFVKVDFDALTSPDNETGGTNVVLQILIDITKATYGSAAGGVALFTIPIAGTFFCSYQSIANNSRMLYAFARDNGVPLARFAKRIHPRTRAPVFGVLYMLLLTSLLATPMCFNAFVFPAVTSFAVVGCYIAYSLPVLCKISTGVRQFLPGPFHLGPRLSYVNNVVSLVWVLTVTVLFTLPQFYPIDLINFNWSAPILGMATAFALGWYYFPKYGAKKWFIGPRANLGQFQDVLPSEVARVASEQQAAAAAARLAASGLPQVQEEPSQEKVAQPLAAGSATQTATAVSAVSAPIAAAAGGGDGRYSVATPAAAATVLSATAVADRSSSSNCIRRISRHSLNKGLRSTPSVTTASLLATAEAPGGGGGAAAAAAVAAAVAAGGGSSASRDALASLAGCSSQVNAAGHIGSPGICSRGGGAGSGAGARRHSAISLMDGRMSCGSHIAQLLQDSGLIDESGPQSMVSIVYGGGGVGVGGGAAGSLYDGRTSTTAAATDGPPTREGLSLFSRPSPGGGGAEHCRADGGSGGGWAAWTGWALRGGGGDSGSGGGLRERPSARGRNRTTPGRGITSIARAAAAAAAAVASGGGGSGATVGSGSGSSLCTSQPLLALGGAPRNSRHPYQRRYCQHPGLGTMSADGHGPPESGMMAVAGPDNATSASAAAAAAAAGVARARTRRASTSAVLPGAAAAAAAPSYDAAALSRGEAAGMALLRARARRSSFGPVSADMVVGRMPVAAPGGVAAAVSFNGGERFSITGGGGGGAAGTSGNSNSVEVEPGDGDGWYDSADDGIATAATLQSLERAVQERCMRRAAVTTGLRSQSGGISLSRLGLPALESRAGMAAAAAAGNAAAAAGASRSMSVTEGTGAAGDQRGGGSGGGRAGDGCVVAVAVAADVLTSTPTG